MLTGESLPVEKHVSDKNLEQKNIIEYFQTNDLK